MTSIFFLIALSFGLGFIIFYLSFYGIEQVYSSEKASAYECGFDPFEDARGVFDVRFYLVAILFILFDLEVAFLFPVVASPELDLFGSVSLIIFLFILTVGFFFEWLNGALDWS